MLVKALFTLVVVLTVLVRQGSAVTSLTHAGTYLFPYQYSPVPLFAYNKDAVRVCAADPRLTFHFLYCGGLNFLDIQDYKNPAVSLHIHLHTYDPGFVRDIEVCDNWVGVLYTRTGFEQEGKLFIYNLFDPDNRELILKHEVTVGANPKSLVWTCDCKKAVVAVGGGPVMAGGLFQDPEGQVAIINFEFDPSDATYSQVTVDFTSLNDRWETYVARGVRYVYRGENSGTANTFSQDLEPEDVTLNGLETRAYVTLEENNAFAVINLQTDRLIDIYPVGFKDWSKYSLDTSTSDGGINLRPQDIWGIYGPQKVGIVDFFGEEHLMATNKGRIKSFSAPDFPFTWTEALTGRQLVSGNRLGDDIPAELATALNSNAVLGQLRVSNIDGLNDNGTISTVYTYGGRGLSLTRVSSMVLDGDSGRDLEWHLSQYEPLTFNGNGEASTMFPEQTFDSRSVYMGPEPSSLVTGMVASKLVAFLGVEKPGVILLYSIEGSDHTFVLQSTHYNGGYGKTWEQLYAEGSSRDVGPSDLEFISAGHSATGKPLLIVVGRVSGSVAYYSVEEFANDDEAKKQASISKPPHFNCNERSQKCSGSIGCYAFEQRCDGIQDCHDGSDEMGCDFIPEPFNSADEEAVKAPNGVPRPAPKSDVINVATIAVVSVTSLALVVVFVVASIRAIKRYQKSKRIHVAEVEMTSPKPGV